MKSILFLSVIFFLVTNNRLSSQTENFYNYIEFPASPNASSFTKFVNIPVDLSTGIPNISINLLNISKGGIDLPISLNYHGGGIRVQEESSCVGLGWSLPLGGMISRTVRSLADDDHNGYLYNCQKMLNEEAVNFALNNSLTAEAAHFNLLDITNNIIDYEPDIFSLTVSGKSASFLFNNHEGISTIPYRDIIINPIYYNRKITGFTVIDEDGLIYYYGDTIQYSSTPSEYIETTSSIHNGRMFGPFNSGWVINEIVNPLSGQKIKFHYTNNFKRTTLGPYKSATLYERELNVQFYVWQQVETFNTTDVNNYNYCQINFIEIDDDTLWFNSSLALENIKKIDQIRFNSQLYNFHYTETDERTFLDSIVIRTIENPKSNKYAFTYSEIDLPDKNSYKIDYWGYYTNRYNGYNSSIPKVKFLNENFGDADRTPNPDYSAAGSLIGIRYPTGGKVDFIYESNYYARPKTIQEVSQQIISDQVIAEVTAGNNQSRDTAIYDIQWANVPNKHSFKIRALFEFPNDFPLNHYGHVQLLDSNNSIVWSHNFNEVSDSIFIERNIDLDTNNLYKLRVISRCANTTTYAELLYSWYRTEDLSIEVDELGGGIRIHKIISQADANSQENITTYKYDLSGYLTALPPQYFSIQTVKRLDPNNILNPTVQELQRILVYSRAVGGLNNSVAYNKVIEIHGTETQNSGTTITYFDEVVDEPSGVDYAPDENNAHLRSNPVRIEYYSKDGQKLKEQINEYEPDHAHSVLVKAFRASRIRTIEGLFVFVVDFPFFYNYGNYYIRNTRTRIKKETSYTYNVNGILKDEVTYEYQNDKHLSPTAIKKINSLKQEEVIINRYPADYLPNFEPCEQEFQDSFLLCNNSGQQCIQDYASCQDSYEDCHEITLSYQNKAWVDRLRFILTFGASTIQDMLLMQQSIDAYSYCISQPNGYIDCVNNFDCGNYSCISNAETNYRQCNFNNDLLVYDLYQSSTDENLRAILLLYLINRKNEVIESISSRDGTVIEHYKNNFSEILSSQNSKIPLFSGQDRLVLNTFENDFSITKYNSRNKPLEITRNNGINKSFQWGYDDLFLITQTSNSLSFESGYTGFENLELNGWEKPTANSFEDHEFFTGESSMKVTSGFGPGRDFYVGNLADNHSGYQASVWVKGSKNAYLHIEANSYTIHQRVENEEETDGWHLLKVTLYKNQYESLIDSNFKIKVYVGNDGSEPAYFDDLRFHPLDAQMITYTYKPLVGITSESDVNNKPSRYEYDGFGRLTHVRDFQDNIIKKYDYHYKQ